MATQPDAERRALPRGRTFWKGTVLFPGGLRSAECTVRNFTSQGARLECGGATDIPDHFDLTIPQKSGTFACRVIWRRGTEIGVSFAAAQEPAGGDLARKIRELADQNRRLIRRIHERESGQD